MDRVANIPNSSHTFYMATNIVVVAKELDIRQQINA